MSIASIKLENFTVFEKIEIDFSKGINVLIGENGTGKTHLLKVICGDKGKDVKISDYFKGETVRKTPKIESVLKNIGLLEGTEELTIEQAEIIKSLLEQKINESSTDEIIKFEEQIQIQKIDIKGKLDKFVFIPAKEMLSHSKGLLPMLKKYSKDMPFDKSLLDIIEVAQYWKIDSVPDIGKAILPKLETIIGGKVILDNDGEFSIKKTDGYLIKFSMEAEGIKKIAVLWQLIMNESITKDSVLFWDEPEANINPKLLRDVAEILLELSRNGVQIFVASHNYIFAKYMEVLMKDSDDVIFHSLYKTDNGVKCESNRNFRELKHNSILSSLDILIEQVFDLDLGD
ncbi:MAG: AAA family ATPase [Eubacteriales bacterium]